MGPGGAAECRSAVSWLPVRTARDGKGTAPAPRRLMSDPAPTDALAAAAAAPRARTQRARAGTATGEDLRAALRGMASPVVVVTVVAPDGPRGATIGSFTSVSLAPPLVSFNVSHGTRLHDALSADCAVAIHLLHAGQAGMASHFATPDLDGDAQLAPFAHTRRDGAPPLLHGTLGVLHGCVVQRLDVGDHSLVVARIDHIDGGTDGEPLLYYRQSYRGVGAPVEG